VRFLDHVRGRLSLGSRASCQPPLIHVFKDGQKIYVPTTAKAKSGFFVDIEPIAVLGDDDVDGLADALASRMAGPLVLVGDQAFGQPAALLRHTRYTRWSQVDQKMAKWAIEPIPQGWRLARNHTRKEDRGVVYRQDSLAELTGPVKSVAGEFARLLAVAS